MHTDSVDYCFLTQVIENLMKRDSLPDWVYRNRKELVRNMKVRVASFAVTM